MEYEEISLFHLTVQCCLMRHCHILREMAVVWSVYLGLILILTGGAFFGSSQPTDDEQLRSTTKSTTTHWMAASKKIPFAKVSLATTTIEQNVSASGVRLSNVTQPSFISLPSANENVASSPKNEEITTSPRIRTNSRHRWTIIPSFPSTVSLHKHEDSLSTAQKVIDEDAVFYVKTTVQPPSSSITNKQMFSTYRSYGTVKTKMKINATSANNGSFRTNVKQLRAHYDDLVRSSHAPFDVTLPATEASWPSNETEASSTSTSTSTTSRDISCTSSSKSFLYTANSSRANFTNAHEATVNASTNVAESTSTTMGTNNVKREWWSKEHSQFPGITLKVSHVLIAKRKRSRYNIHTMNVEFPKTENSSRFTASSGVPKSSKNSNCTRFPVQVVTASDTESKEKVNLTQEHYDCEFSSRVLGTRQRGEPIESIHTYYGGYVFRYVIPNVSSNNNSVTLDNRRSIETARKTRATTVENNDDYDSSYIEYPDTVNGGHYSGTIDDTVFPDPLLRNAKAASSVRAMPEPYNSVPVSDSSSSMDSDLHDHDVIDSVMYIYFGGASHGQRGAGRQIIIVGAVIALVAQFLTLASCIRRIKTHKGEEPTIILLNVETALTLTNLIFILGVQSTGDPILCKITAVSLYYLHLATLTLFLLSSLYSVQIVCQIKSPCTFFKYCVCSWLIPLVTTLLCYLLNERSFETSLYCWVSPLKGILYSFILPIILLCIICIVLTICGLKRVTELVDDVDNTYSHRKLLRIAAVALPLFSVIWFSGMVALENSTSLLFSLIFLISDTVLNWLLFACWLPSEASQWKDMDEDYYDDDEDFDDEPVLVKRRFDDQPLLSELYEYGVQGQFYNLKIEPISIISTP